MRQCYICQTPTIIGKRDGIGRWICKDCLKTTNTLHYDLYNTETQSMVSPDLGQNPRQYCIDFIYQLNNNNGNFIPILHQIQQKHNYSWLDVVRTIEYLVYVKKIKQSPKYSIVTMLPSKIEEAKKYYNIISNHHLQLYKSQELEQTQEITYIETSHPKRKTKSFSMEDI